MPEVVFRDWVFAVDDLQTRLAYSKEESGYSDGCDCSDCENYRSQKEKVFPHEALQLFESLGLDYRKESEVYAVEDTDNGLVRYFGWFHFAGKDLRGPDCKQAISKDAWAIHLNPIDEGFKIGFTAGNDLSFFDAGESLVQVEFESELPWVISRARESET